MEQKNSLLSITSTEAFEIGRLEGLKEALKEVMDLADADPQFIKKYCEARIKSLNEYPKILGLKRGLS